MSVPGGESAYFKAGIFLSTVSVHLLGRKNKS